VNLPQARRADPVTAQPLYVTIPATFSGSRRLMIDKDEIPIDALAERVKQALLTRDDKSIYLRMDATVTAQDMFTITDRLKEAGVQKIGLVAQPPKQ
jgi:biopolymer transport protein TolR